MSVAPGLKKSSVQSDSNPAYVHFKLTPSSGALGASVSGLELKALDDAEFVELRRALDDYQVLSFSDQELTTQEYLGFAKCFGEVVQFPFSPGIPDYPDVFEVLKEAHHTSNFGGGWHTDSPFLSQPPMYTMLHALETPVHGGDTLITNQYLAWEALSSGLQDALLNVGASFSASLKSSGGRANRHRDYTHMALCDMDRANIFEEVHPLVRKHPRTGKPSLYVSEAHMLSLDGFLSTESELLLNYLYQHSSQSEFCTRVQWAPGTLTIFDNACTQHYALNDYHGERRRMHRITVDPQSPISHSA